MIFKKERSKKAGFTLAEILITITVIGVVAALTLPILTVKLREQIRNHQISTFEHKLSRSTDLLNLNNGIGPYYPSTINFVRALSKHLKIVATCDKGNVESCFNYKNIDIGADEPLALNEITTGAYLGLDTDSYPDVAAMVLADGTPMLLSFNVNCPISDPASRKYSQANWKNSASKSSTTSCIKGVFDVNGSKGPNKLNQDVIPFDATLQKIASKKKFKCTPYTIEGTTICVGENIYRANQHFNSGLNCVPSSSGYAGDEYCLEEGKGNPKYTYNNDYYAQARKNCTDEGGVLPDRSTMEKLFRHRNEIPVLGNAWGSDDWFLTSSGSAEAAGWYHIHAGYRTYYKNVLYSNFNVVCIGEPD